MPPVPLPLMVLSGHRQSRITDAYACATAASSVTINRAASYCTCRAVTDGDAAAAVGIVAANNAVRHHQRSDATVEDAAAGDADAAAYVAEAANSVATDNAVYHRQLGIAAVDAASRAASTVTINRAAGYCQCRSGIVKDAAALLVLVGGGGGVAHGDVAECKPSVVKDPTPSIVVSSKAVGDGETGDGDVRGEIFKHAGTGVAVDRQISGTGAVDGHVVGNLKFAAGQQDGAGDAGGVNRVAVIRDGERVAQRAGAAVIGVCDYDDVSWQRIAESH